MTISQEHLIHDTINVQHRIYTVYNQKKPLHLKIEIVNVKENKEHCFHFLKTLKLTFL